MGFITDQLRKRLEERKKSKKLGATFNKTPKKDITFLPADTPASAMTEHVNNRILFLMNQVGGADKFGEGDFTIQYIDQTKDTDIIQKSTKSLARKTAKDSSSVLGPGNRIPEYDWEPVEEEIVSELAPNINVNQLQFYMIIIEYTHIKEVV